MQTIHLTYRAVPHSHHNAAAWTLPPPRDPRKSRRNAPPIRGVHMGEVHVVPSQWYPYGCRPISVTPTWYSYGCPPRGRDPHGSLPHRSYPTWYPHRHPPTWVGPTWVSYGRPPTSAQPTWVSPHVDHTHVVPTSTPFHMGRTYVVSISVPPTWVSPTRGPRGGGTDC